MDLKRTNSPCGLSRGLFSLVNLRLLTLPSCLGAMSSVWPACMGSIRGRPSPQMNPLAYVYTHTALPSMAKNNGGMWSRGVLQLDPDAAYMENRLRAQRLACTGEVKWDVVQLPRRLAG